MTMIKGQEEDKILKQAKQFTKFGLVGLLGAIGMGGIIVLSTYLSGERIISVPKKAIIQQGYAYPSKIEKIIAEDRDGIKGNEVYFYYGKNSYLLKEDEQGKPYIQEYELKPAEIIEKQ